MAHVSQTLCDLGCRQQVRNLLGIDGMNCSGTYLCKFPLTDILKEMSLTTNIQIAKIAKIV